jgi:osmotically-inducible protein OsmY
MPVMVKSDVEIKRDGLVRADTQIATAVRRALEWDSLVPDEKIHSTVTGGWVTLAGDVDLLADREDAERVVRRLPGVKGVENAIQVRAHSADAHKIRKAIEEALERRADREARRIEVTVHDGKVSLAGEVRSWFERRAIIGTVSHAPGVSEVEDHLHVEAPV